MKERVPETPNKTGAKAFGAGASTLAALLKERGALPQPEIIWIFCQVLRELEHVHNQRMLHRDITPARIVRDEVDWKLVDYGLPGLGTVRYMSPERCQGRALDERSDIYSLGVVLFEAATGSVPFDAQMKHQLMEAHVSKAPPAPRGFNRQVSAEIEQIILRALSKNPADRYQTATEFREAMEALAEPVPIDAAIMLSEPEQPSATEVAPANQQSRLRPILLIISALVLVTAATLFFVLTSGTRVPLVVGMAQGEAATTLDAKGLDPAFEDRDDTILAGQVLAQEPAAGARAPGDKRVSVYVSTGMVPVPPLGGATLEQARNRLRVLALEVGRTDSQYTDDYARGSVAASEPKAGAKLAPHAPVNLLVSRGRATCPECGTRRQSGAQFCTNCGYKFL